MSQNSLRKMAVLRNLALVLLVLVAPSEASIWRFGGAGKRPSGLHSSKGLENAPAGSLIEGLRQAGSPRAETPNHQEPIRDSRDLQTSSYYQCGIDQGGSLSSGYIESCGGLGRRCSHSAKYMAVSRIGEQLSKARQHLGEVAVLARLTNRTLILPSVGRSQIGSGYYFSLPFCTYFDTQAISEFVDWVTEDYFTSAVAPQKGSKVDLLTLFLGSSAACNQRDPNRRARFEDHWLGPEDLKDGQLACTTDCAVHKQVLSALQTLRLPASAQADVVVVNKSTNYGCYNGPEQKEAMVHVRYAPHLHKKLAEFQEAHLGERYLAIHWRTERSMMMKLPQERVMECAKGLVATARAALANHNLSRVFIAADISLRDQSRSASMDQEKLLQKRVWLLQALQEVFRELNPVTWEDFGSFPTLDLGIQGILDKLACIGAAHFLHAPSKCIGFWPVSLSSFAREIVETRQATGGAFSTSEAWTV